MTSIVAVGLVTVALLGVNAFFVASEFASVRARRTRIEQLADQGHAGAVQLLPILSSPARLDRYIATCQIGITVTGLLLGFYAQDALAPPLAQLFGRLVGRATAIALATAVALVLFSGLQIVMAELVPKAVAVRYPERLALATALPMRVSERLLTPLVWLFNGTASAVLRLVGIRGPASHSHVHSPEEIELLVAESGQAGALDDAERRMLHKAFDLSQLVARQVMIPRNRVAAADVTSTVASLLERLAGSPYSRMAVYEGSVDTVVGVVHLKDLLRLNVAGASTVEDIVRPIPAVPETMPVSDLWQVLNQRNVYLALVIDEYGGTAGLVSQEDLLDEIIGDVQDEFDPAPEPMVHGTTGEAVVRGDVLVEHINASLGTDLPTDRADTVGGLIMDALGRLAETGDSVTVAGVRMTVLSVSGRSVARASVAVPPEARRMVDDG